MPPKLPSSYIPAKDKTPDMGNTMSMEALAGMYEDGSLGGKDYSKAIYWYEKSANSGGRVVYDGMHLGELYSGGGNGLTKNNAKARDWYEKIKDGLNVSLVYLGRIYEEGGYGVTRDYKKALDYYTQAKQRGLKEDADIARVSGLMRGNKSKEDNTPPVTNNANTNSNAVTVANATDLLNKGLTSYKLKDYTQAKTSFESAARLGNTEAMRSLASMYENGIGVQQNYTTSTDWYKKAAEGGDNASMEYMGSLYEFGVNGVKKDYNTALDWYTKAQQGGNSRATSDIERIKNLIATTQTVTSPMVSVVNNTNNAANPTATVPPTNVQGAKTVKNNSVAPTLPPNEKAGENTTSVSVNAIASYNKGFDEYKSGNIAGAKENWERAAQANGNSPAKFSAMNELGNLYFNGKGVDKDYVKSLDWYQKAANDGLPNGDRNAAKSVGTQYENGYGTTQSYAEALAWYKKAKKLGNQYVDGDIARTSQKVKAGY